MKPRLDSELSHAGAVGLAISVSSYGRRYGIVCCFEASYEFAGFVEPVEFMGGMGVMEFINSMELAGFVAFVAFVLFALFALVATAARSCFRCRYT
jgi:hypothetical protein